eukprot:COSAG01_NODE_6959_length_3416_cov_33.694001_3_plen_81_part_00
MQKGCRIPERRPLQVFSQQPAAMYKRFEVAAALSGQAAATSNRLYSRLLAENLERPPFWGYCTILWVRVDAASHAHRTAC